jgi:hypothetical protein
VRTSEILAKAADVVEAVGLHKGSLAGRDGSVCAVGAIRVAAGAVVENKGTSLVTVGMTPSTLCYAADTAVIRFQDHLGMWPAKWNDDPLVSQDMVVEELRQASAVEAEREAAG